MTRRVYNFVLLIGFIVSCGKKQDVTTARGKTSDATASNKVSLVTELIDASDLSSDMVDIALKMTHYQIDIVLSQPCPDVKSAENVKKVGELNQSNFVEINIPRGCSYKAFLKLGRVKSMGSSPAQIPVQPAAAPISAAVSQTPPSTSGSAAMPAAPAALPSANPQASTTLSLAEETDPPSQPTSQTGSTTITVPAEAVKIATAALATAAASSASSSAAATPSTTPITAPVKVAMTSTAALPVSGKDLQEVYYSNSTGIDITEDYIEERSQVDLKFVLDLTPQGKQLGLHVPQIGGRSYKRGTKIVVPSANPPATTPTPVQPQTSIPPTTAEQPTVQ